MTQRKPKRANNLHLLSGDQQQALGKFQKDLKTAMPHMVEMATAAKRLHQGMLDAPFWRVMDGPRPDEAEEPQEWTVGHAQVNYVDHIKTTMDNEGTQEK